MAARKEDLLTHEDFAKLVAEIKAVAANPDSFPALLEKISGFSTPKINTRYFASRSVPYENILEATLAACVDATDLPKASTTSRSLASTTSGSSSTTTMGSSAGKLPEEYPLEIFGKLVELGADLDTPNHNNNFTPMHYIIFPYDAFPNPESRERYYAVVKTIYNSLRFSGVNFDARDMGGQTILLLAATKKHYEMIPVLHETYGCDLNIPDKGFGAKIGQTVFDVLQVASIFDKRAVNAFNYVVEKGGVSGKALAEESFAELHVRLGGKEIKSEKEIMESLAEKIDLTTLKPKRDDWHHLTLEETNMFRKLKDQKDKETAETAAKDREAKEQAAKEREAAEKATAPVPIIHSASRDMVKFKTQLAAVRVACLTGNKISFLKTVKELTSDQWNQLRNAAETDAGGKWYETFLKYSPSEHSAPYLKKKTVVAPT